MQRTRNRRAAVHFTNRASRDGVTQVRQPRPAPRRQGTRSAIVAAATREG